MMTIIHTISNTIKKKMGRVRDQFNTLYYISKYADVEASGVDPWRHYIDHGAKEGRDPAPWFSTQYYLQTNQDVARSKLNPF